MLKDSRRRGTFANTVRAALPLAVALVVGLPSHAEVGRWRVQFEPIFMQATGNDRHVLTIHETRTGPPQTVDLTGVNLDTESGVAPRFEIQYVRGAWTFGADLYMFNTSQDVGPFGAAAGGGISQVIFEVSDSAHVSSGPAELLFYDTLEDTDLETWTFDLYAMKTLATRDRSRLQMQFGLRFADFDNDYHGVVGIESIGGSFLDASSNYPRMAGPLLGLVGSIRHGKNEFEGYFGQSVVFGTAELSNSRDDFTGPSSMPTVTDSQVFRFELDEGIPITEFRFKWKYWFNKRIAAGAGVHSSIWWDVSVPPGVTPGPDGNTLLYENNFVFFGLLGVVELTF